MLPSFVGMIFVGIMTVLVVGIYALFGRHVLRIPALEGGKVSACKENRYEDTQEDFSVYADEIIDETMDQTMIRGLEETVLFQPQENKENLAAANLQNTLVLPMTEKVTFSDSIEDTKEREMPEQEEKDVIVSGVLSVKEKAEKQEKAASKNQPQSFGSQTCWLAIRAKNMKEVAEVLEVEHRHSCSWQDGLEASEQNDGSVFVTPPIGDWVLVIGRSILKKIGLDDPLDSFKWIKEVSEQFGLVYYFCTHEKAQYHAWIKADEGEIERAYAYSGKENEVLWEWGEITDTERVMFDNLEAYYGNRIVDEAVVLALAAKWTVDTSFKTVKGSIGAGILGKLE